MTTPLSQFSNALADAVAKAAASTVVVVARRRFPATGIAYSSELILTADHVVEFDEDIYVILPDGKKVGAKLAGRAPNSDLALLRLEEPLATPAQMFEGAARVGEIVLAMGRHTKDGPEASLGVVSFVNGPTRTRRGGMLESYIRTDTTPLPGFSGGPLINAEGLVLGINTSGLSHGSLLTIPVASAWKTAASLAEHGSIKRGFIGIQSQVVELPANSQEVLGREQDTGLLLVGIVEGSPATEAGLMVGDIIVGVDGEPVTVHDELHGLLMGDVVGQPTPIDILRGGKAESVEVTIGERDDQMHDMHERRGPRGMHERHRLHGRGHGDHVVVKRMFKGRGGPRGLRGHGRFTNIHHHEGDEGSDE